MKGVLHKIIASIAICGMVVFTTIPAIAASEYDPNDQLFDPSGTLVVPPSGGDGSLENNVDESITASGVEEAAVISTDEDSAIPEDDVEVVAEESVALEEENTVDQSAENIETGTGSDNDTEVVQDNDSEATIGNTADIDNNIEGEANTGINNADFNSGNGEIETGDSDLVANIVTAANTVVNTVESLAMPVINIFSDLIGDINVDFNGGNSVDGLSLQQIVSNYLTGADSQNDAISEVENNSSTDINNDGNLNSNLNLTSNTGDNSASSNTGDGLINTGDANIAANVINFLNNTINAQNMWLGMFNIFGDWIGNLIMPSFNSEVASNTLSQTAANADTGYGSENTAINDLSQNSETDIDNNAALINDITASGNTGDNSASYNTGDGSIQSGAVNIKSNDLAVANNTVVGDSWWMMIVNSLSGWDGAIIGAPDGSTQFVPFLYGSEATNIATGPDSDNLAQTEVENNIDTEINNEAAVDNNLNLLANTGGNSADFNTGDGEIETGDANIISNLVNFVNNTFDVKNWAFGIINVFGEWNGSAQFGSEPDNDTLIAGSGLNVESVNDSTGANSDNIAANTVENSSELTINNNLSIDRDTDLNANTGRNRADYNTGSGFVETGDIDAEANFLAKGNITEITVTEGDLSDFELLSQNTETGANSENNAFTAICGKLKLAINNVAKYVKDIDMNLNTGENTADKNTGGGEIVTGDINAVVREKTELNIVKIRKALIEICEEEEAIGGGEEEIVENQISPFGEILPVAGSNGSIAISIFATIATMLLIRKKYL